MFANGVDFERIFATRQGPLGALATVNIRGDQLELRDLMVYPAETTQRLRVGVREILHIVRQIEAEARLQGFHTMLVIAKRVSGARPGRIIHLTRRLR